ncbi:hypothetical protein PV10_05605 [Exophiala mesophila]|uniref:Cohesin loading factor n=1 Tax=Exophiala mesophila TaxID=212818 RepID=A0A0D1ZW84_EXOME|nr:uncharacterized protein PV10_05605 [Exophiala mesophila]KIV91013.1 hypothetical protein PV10_05605 [Exophiala mesophila]
MPPNFDFAMNLDMDPELRDFYYNNNNNQNNNASFSQPNLQYHPQGHLGHSQPHHHPHHQIQAQAQPQPQARPPSQPRPQPSPQYYSHQPSQAIIAPQASQPYLSSGENQLPFQYLPQFQPQPRNQPQQQEYQFHPQAYPQQPTQNLNYPSYYQASPPKYQADFNQYSQPVLHQQQAPRPNPVQQHHQHNLHQPQHQPQPQPYLQTHSAQPQPFSQSQTPTTQYQTRPTHPPQQPKRPSPQFGHQPPRQPSPNVTRHPPPQSSPRVKQDTTHQPQKTVRPPPPPSPLPKHNQSSPLPMLGNTIEVVIPSHQQISSQANQRSSAQAPPATPQPPKSSSQQSSDSTKPPQTISQPSDSIRGQNAAQHQPVNGSHLQPSNNQHPQTVSMSQLEKKPSLPIASTSKPQHIMIPTPKPLPRILQSVEIKSRPKSPTIKEPPPGDSPAPEWPEPDYKTALMYVADDLLDSARTQPGNNPQYYDKIAAVITCLQALLTKTKLQPLELVQVSLHYSQVLYDETENYDDAETQLVKAIEIAGRHKLIDHKYEMQLLLSKVLYESKPKAAMREIQRIIEDIEAYHHTAWLYVFRWQHAIFASMSSPIGELHGAVSQVQKMASLAKRHSDSAVMALASVMEAQFHLSSSSHDSITNAQNALATARSMQLDVSIKDIPQLTLLVALIDLACSLHEFQVVEADRKSKEIKELFYECKAHENWRNDNYIYLPVSQESIAGTTTQTSRHLVERKGKYYLKFEWLGKSEVEVLIYLLCANSVAHRNSVNGEKAEGYAQGGLDLLRALQERNLAGPYVQIQHIQIRHRLLEAHLLFTLSFLMASKGSWEATWKYLSQITAILDELKDDFPINMRVCLAYLKGSTLQGLGKLSAAMETYQSPELQFKPQQSSPSLHATSSRHQSRPSHTESDITRCFTLLAAMNSAFIMQDPNHPQNSQVPSLIHGLQPAVENCGNKAIRAYYELVISALVHKSIQVKHHLRASLDAGKEIGSLQITTLALICMQDRAFKGQVEERAVKCARAAGSQAKSWKEPLWTHVALGYEADSLEINGFAKTAVQRREESEQAWDRLPEDVKRIKRSVDV